MAEIHKAAGIIIRDKKLLVERSKGKDFFKSPGGSIEAGETSQQALVRELLEEFKIKVCQQDLEYFGTFTAAAAGQEYLTVRMEVYNVKKYQGEPSPDNEVEEIAWITSKTKLKLGSIFEHDVIPSLKNLGLIS